MSQDIDSTSSSRGRVFCVRTAVLVMVQDRRQFHWLELLRGKREQGHLGSSLEIVRLSWVCKYRSGDSKSNLDDDHGGEGKLSLPAFFGKIELLIMHHGNGNIAICLLSVGSFGDIKSFMCGSMRIYYPQGEL